MSEITVGLTCPSCGGTISISEGEESVNCQYCDSTLHVAGDQGVTTISMRNMVTEDKAMDVTRKWWKKGLKARDLDKVGKIEEMYPIYLPFWNIGTRVAGWVCGYNERQVTDSKGRTHTERDYKEEMVLQDHRFIEIACDPGDLGIARLDYIAGESIIQDTDMIPCFKSTTSRDDAIIRAKNKALSDGERSAHVEHVTFRKLHVLPRSMSLVNYPVWVVRYNYHDRSYMLTVDGVNGRAMSGRAPGDPLYQSLAATGGASAGGLIAAAGIASGYPTAAVFCVAIGVVVLYFTYRFFRHGSERAEGDFKDKKSSKIKIGDVASLAVGRRRRY